MEHIFYSAISESFEIHRDTFIAKKFKAKQKKTGLSNRKTAEYLGVTYSTIKRWRNGASDAPKSALLALDYKISQLKNSENND